MIQRERRSGEGVGRGSDIILREEGKEKDERFTSHNLLRLFFFSFLSLSNFRVLPFD